MSKGKTELVSVRVVPNTSGNPPGKLADAELTFEADAGPLSGLKLIGFGTALRGHLLVLEGRAAERGISDIHEDVLAREWRDHFHFAALLDSRRRDGPLVVKLALALAYIPGRALLA